MANPTPTTVQHTAHPGLRALVLPTTLGPLLVAASERGVCLVRFGASAAQLLAQLRSELPWAELAAPDARLRGWAQEIAGLTEGRPPSLEVPLDVRGSRFQQRVWEAIRRIPRGETRSYAELARACGQPGASRAVGRACGANPAALVTPCHRVVRGDGSLGGYAFGPERKRALLEREGAAGAYAAVATGVPRSSTTAATTVTSSKPSPIPV